MRSQTRASLNKSIPEAWDDAIEGSQEIRYGTPVHLVTTLRTGEQRQ